MASSQNSFYSLAFCTLHMSMHISMCFQIVIVYKENFYLFIYLFFFLYIYLFMYLFKNKTFKLIDKHVLCSLFFLLKILFCH